MGRQSLYGTRNLLGPGIAYIRAKQGLSQKDLLVRIELLGGCMAQTKLSRIERGNTILQDYDLIVIAAALRVSLDEIYRAVKAKKS